MNDLPVLIADIERHVVARFPADERDILLSGWALGTEKLERRGRGKRQE